MESLAEIKSRQVSENNPKLGIDCLQKGTNGKKIRFFIIIISF